MKPLTYDIVFLTLDFSVLGEFFFHYMKPHLLVLWYFKFPFSTNQLFAGYAFKKNPEFGNEKDIYTRIKPMQFY